MRTQPAGQNAEPTPRAPFGAVEQGAVTCEARPGMVNGYLPRSMRREDFAGYGRRGGVFCPLIGAPRQSLSNCFRTNFSIGTASAAHLPRRRLGRSRGMHDGRCRGDGIFVACRGSVPMENALLVGLSRQMALSRELDVVANNIANIDTTGFKADNAAFSEFLMPGARDDEFTRQRPPRQLRAGPRQLDRSQPRRDPAHRQSARRRHRRQRLPRGADAARTDATPATARSRSTPPASSSPATAIR